MTTPPQPPKKPHRVPPARNRKKSDVSQAVAVRPSGRLRPLTPRELAFVCAYVGASVTAGNAVASALAAGYSKATATSQSIELLRRPSIAAAIEARAKAQLEEVTKEVKKETRSLIDAYAKENIDTARLAHVMNLALVRAEEELTQKLTPDGGAMSRNVVALLALLHAFYGPPKGLSQTGSDDGRYVSGPVFDYEPQWVKVKRAEMLAARCLPPAPVIDGKLGG